MRRSAGWRLLCPKVGSVGPRRALLGSRKGCIDPGRGSVGRRQGFIGRRGCLGTIAAVLLLGILLPSLSASALTITDQTGRSITLPAPPRRIVSLVPSVTEILFAIGAQAVLVGVTDFCDYPPEARKKPSVGGMVAPSLETIVALKPDLVVATSAGNGEAVLTQLDRLKIAVYVVNPTRLDDVFDLIARLGALTGHEAEATRLSARLAARVRAVAERVAALPRPRVLYVLWPDPLHRARARRARLGAARPGRCCVGHGRRRGRVSAL